MADFEGKIDGVKDAAANIASEENKQKLADVAGSVAEKANSALINRRKRELYVCILSPDTRAANGIPLRVCQNLQHFE